MKKLVVGSGWRVSCKNISKKMKKKKWTFSRLTIVNRKGRVWSCLKREPYFPWSIRVDFTWFPSSFAETWTYNVNIMYAFYVRYATWLNLTSFQAVEWRRNFLRTQGLVSEKAPGSRVMCHSRNGAKRLWFTDDFLKTYFAKTNTNQPQWSVKKYDIDLLFWIDGRIFLLLGSSRLRSLKVKKNR